MKADDASRPVDLAQEPDFALGSLQVRPSLREVLVSGEREVLEPRVMQVLVALARRPDQVISRDQLIDACWAGRVVGEDAINRCIARVRRLAETHGGFSVETIARVGYRLTVESAAVAAPPEPVAAPQARNPSRWIVPVVVAALMVGGRGLRRHPADAFAEASAAGRTPDADRGAGRQRINTARPSHSHDL
jgi:DNA-binding winged helix-turn-helix (wHTH) protein